MSLRRTLVGLCGVGVLGCWWLSNHRTGPVVLPADHVDATAIRAAMREIDGAVRGHVDTIDLRRPRVLRVVVQAPAGRRLRDDAAFAQARVDHVVMQAHAELTWRRLEAVLSPARYDTVHVTQHRPLRWDNGLPGLGRETHNERYGSLWQRGWSGSRWPGPVAAGR